MAAAGVWAKATSRADLRYLDVSNTVVVDRPIVGEADKVEISYAVTADCD